MPYLLLRTSELQRASANPLPLSAKIFYLRSPKLRIPPSLSFFSVSSLFSPVSCKLKHEFLRACSVDLIFNLGLHTSHRSFCYCQVSKYQRGFVQLISILNLFVRGAEMPLHCSVYSKQNTKSYRQNSSRRKQVRKVKERKIEILKRRMLKDQNTRDCITV